MKLRLIDPVFFSVRGDGTYVSSPRIKGRLKVHPSVAGILTTAVDGIDLKALAAESEALAHAVEKLHELGYLVPMDDTANGELPGPWHEWGALTWQFHQSIRDTPFIRPESEGIDAYYEELRHSDRPANSKRSHDDEDVLLLPRIRTRMPASFQDVLEGRRTHRDFTGDATPSTPSPPCCITASDHSASSTRAGWACSSCEPTPPAARGTRRRPTWSS